MDASTSAGLFGSSPLARGLHGPGQGRTGQSRIIPARAGFTRSLSPRSAGGWDHPRSRGVYPITLAPVSGGLGSSPLARGLRDGQVGVGGVRGIIPARAGFTRARGSSRRGCADHPRSRGVYAPGRPGGPAALRIIPARAGFTPGRQGQGPGAQDHPRSRGVYRCRSASRVTASGSSPLARGLPPAARERAWRSGIIPARAGFTADDPVEVVPIRDHPRSRGVYVIVHDSSGTTAGSSPLARGLRVPNSRRTQVRRIIPARAGFTCWPSARARWRWDHPRSRGVYARPRPAGRRAGGSSPLARGLPVHWYAPDWPTGIIPARAGFTGRGRPSAGRPGDHPRSRGVYGYEGWRERNRRGSSPLARGLLRSRSCAVSAPRIIPARAGFTGPTGAPTPWRRDHPRSRGVYTPTPIWRSTLCGSSPLARGLRRASHHLHRRVGIIPARAGFTGTHTQGMQGEMDHPRSRGVYVRPHSQDGAVRGSSPLARGLPTGPSRPRCRSRIIPARAGFTPARVEHCVPP